MGKLKKDSVAIIIAVVLVFVYILYQCYSVAHIELETQTATLSTVFEKIDTTALVIRDEHTIENAQSGITVPCVSDGDKINVGGNVAMKFNSSADAEQFSSYSEVEEKLRYYENLESQTVGQAASVESINSEIADDIDEYIRSVNRGDMTDVYEKGSFVNDSILRRQLIVGENIDLVSIIQELRQQEQSFSTTKPVGYIKTDVSGVFSSYTDGFENIVDYKNATSLSYTEIENAIDSVKNGKTNNEHLGKLVTSYAWYFVCSLDSSEVKELEDGDKVEVALKDSDDTIITMQIVSGAEPDAGSEKTALILKSSTLNSKLATLRCEEIEIRTGEKEGFKVPTSALHVSDGKKGVYALVSSQVRFRETTVIYSEDDYVLLAFDPENKNSVRLYDKIITKGKELEDGKVYT